MVCNLYIFQFINESAKADHHSQLDFTPESTFLFQQHHWSWLAGDRAGVAGTAMASPGLAPQQSAGNWPPKELSLWHCNPMCGYGIKSPVERGTAWEWGTLYSSYWKQFKGLRSVYSFPQTAVKPNGNQDWTAPSQPALSTQDTPGYFCALTKLRHNALFFFLSTHTQNNQVKQRPQRNLHCLHLEMRHHALQCQKSRLQTPWTSLASSLVEVRQLLVTQFNMFLFKNWSVWRS